MTSLAVCEPSQFLTCLTPPEDVTHMPPPPPPDPPAAGRATASLATATRLLAVPAHQARASFTHIARRRR